MYTRVLLTIIHTVIVARQSWRQVFEDLIAVSHLRPSSCISWLVHVVQGCNPYTRFAAVHRVALTVILYVRIVVVVAVAILLYKALGWCSTVAGYTCSGMHENNINCTTHIMYGGGGGVELRGREAAQGQSDWKKK